MAYPSPLHVQETRRALRLLFLIVLPVVLSKTLSSKFKSLHLIRTMILVLEAWRLPSDVCGHLKLNYRPLILVAPIVEPEIHCTADLDEILPASNLVHFQLTPGTLPSSVSSKRLRTTLSYKRLRNHSNTERQSFDKQSLLLRSIPGGTMDPATTTLAILVSILAAYVVFHRRSAVSKIIGPPSASWIFGHMRELILSPRYGDHEFAWQKIYGPIYRVAGCIGERLMVSDPVALQYLLNSPVFVRGPLLDGLLTLVFGENSLIVVRGEFDLFVLLCEQLIIVRIGAEHRRLRGSMNAGFTSAAVRNYLPVFQKAAEMVSNLFEKSTTASTDICPILSTATLAAITEAVLGSSIEDLGEDFVENNIRLIELTASQSETQILTDAIIAHFPSWMWEMVMYLPTTAAKVMRKERYLTDLIGRRIVREKMDATSKGLELNNDVFSLLYSARKLSAEDVAAQTSIILVAGQETTANTVAFALLELARHSDFQDELRAEILDHGGTHIAYDNMPMLNALIKEVLRLYPALPLSDRVPLEDTVIPLSEAITTSNGTRISQIPVRKGEVVTMAIAAYQRLASRWGDNPDEFNPARWLDGTTYQGEALSPYANLLSFIGGPRICLGWRFA
ncbi:cytochrome P450 [Mycena polygramma]|nr:cytochrome P450 [Mycena polygramma]